jgi:hypothetical protein
MTMLGSIHLSSQGFKSNMGDAPARLILNESIQDFFEVTVHDEIELVQGQTDAVVRQPVLRKIVGSDPLGAIS